MKKLAAPVLLSLVLLCGCAQHYVIKMTNGGEVTTRGKPKLNGAHYEYKDVNGKAQRIPAGRVTEIEPATMAMREKSFFTSPPGR
jgi:hypothetical protein